MAGGGASEAGPAAATEREAAETFRAVHPARFLERFLEERVRPDGRSLHAFRRCTVAMGEVGTADGSAIARLGRTTAVAGVKAELGNPPMDAPGRGWLVANVTLPSMCSLDVPPGPPPPEAQTMSLFLADTLAGAVDLGSLSLAEGKLSWVLHLDVVVLSHDGNLTDVCTLAAVAALRDLRLPRLSAIGPDDDSLPAVVESRAVRVAVDGPPVAVSFAQCAGEVLADATSFEETLADQTVTLVLSGTSGRLAGTLQPSPSAGTSVGSANARPREGGLGAETLKLLYAQACKRAVEVSAMLDAADKARPRRQ